MKTDSERCFYRQSRSLLQEKEPKRFPYVVVISYAKDTNPIDQAPKRQNRKKQPLENERLLKSVPIVNVDELC